MLSFSGPLGRRSRRVVWKRPASLVVNVNSRTQRLPCLVLDSSKNGYRLRAGFGLRHGQAVDLIVGENPPMCEHCTVVWIGKTGSQQEGEAGVERTSPLALS
jgi:hypothetical protein